MKQIIDLEDIINNEKLTKEQKLKIINQNYEDYRKQIDKNLNDYLLKQYLGATLEIGSAALPNGSLSGQVAKRILPAALTKTVGRKFSQNVAQSTIGSAINGAVFGTGRGLIENKNPLQTALQDTTLNSIIGGTLGAASGKIINDARAVDVNGINQMRPIWGIPFRKASGNPEEAIKTLMENQKGFVPNVFNKQGIGNFDIPWGDSKSGLSHAIQQRINQNNFDINEFINNIPSTIREGIVTPGGIKYPENTNIESLNHKLAIAPSIKKANIDRNWMVTAHPQNKSARKRLGDLTPSTNVTSENGSIPHSISELLTKNNITDFLLKNNPSNGLNSEVATTINSAVHNINLPELPNTINNQQEPFKLGIEMNVDTNGNILDFGQPTGFAASMDIDQLAQQLGLTSFGMQISQLPQLNQPPQQVQKTQPQPKKQGLFGYKNPLTGDNRIFTREDVGAMNKDEFSQNEKAIYAQNKEFGGFMPSNGDLEHEALTGGGVVKVNSYTRADGTQVKGYYRSKPEF